MDTDRSRPLSRRHLLRIMGGPALVLGGAAWVAGHRVAWPELANAGQAIGIMGAMLLAFSMFAAAEPVQARQWRHLRTMVPAILIYLVLIFAYGPLLARVHQPVARALIALLPVLPMVFIVRALVGKLIDGDELERRMQLEAVSIASLSVGLLSFAAGTLDEAGVLHLAHPLGLVLPALIVAYAVALLWVRRRYQGP